MPNLLLSSKSLLSNIYHSLKLIMVYNVSKRFNRLIIQQRANPLEIPILIINYNQLYYLRKLVNFLQDRRFSNIVIIDNQSDFPPLLEYYNSIQGSVTIEYMQENYGHMVFFKNKELQQRYGKGYFVLSDADIVPNEKLPAAFMSRLISLLDKHYLAINKVGFALELDDIPDHYPLKAKVTKWERQFWEKQLEPDVFLAHIDTTFAVYKSLKQLDAKYISFYNAIRVGGQFKAQHGGWYADPLNPTDEYLHYQKTSSSSNSWKADDHGNIQGEYRSKYT